MRVTHERCGAAAEERPPNLFQQPINEAALLPCSVPGEVERRWRVFLRTAAEFPQVVLLGQRAGFDEILRGQLNTTYTRVQQAYNEFVAAVNS